MKKIAFTVALLVGGGTSGGVLAQTFSVADPMLERLWQEGMENSRTWTLAQTLLDSIGPRLTGTPQHESGNEWLVQTYQKWGISAKAEPYSEWMRWSQGRMHFDLISPRPRSLEGTLMAWSPGTGGRAVRAEVVTLPTAANSADFNRWLGTISGKIVAISPPEPTCRPSDNWDEFAARGSQERMDEQRTADQRSWNDRVQATGHNARMLPRVLEQAGATAVLTSRWSSGWGVQKVFAARTERVPQLDVSCEDYGLLVRMAESGQHPTVELWSDAELLGMGPVANVIATIPGTELPNEYVMLSAHFDSWHAGSGATDNGTGTITMLEAMRILKQVYPNPKRTILVGHWAGEEQGLNGSRGFAAAHPEVVEGLQALFNQDNGTGRVVRISAQGLPGASEHFARWLSRVPSEMSDNITFTFPGTPSGGGSDQASFICHGAPAFSLGALSWSYGTYTWHTNRDTFDKIVFEDLTNNATLTAMLAYLASEDRDRVPRERRIMPRNPRTGEQSSWPECSLPRTWDSYSR